jgi:glycosyltransferase involved in cell wall biosynthesis
MFYLDGVDKGAFLRMGHDQTAAIRLGVPEGNRIVLTVSRLHEQKRIGRLLTAAPGVLSEMKDVTFLIVGEGDDRARLERMADSLGVRNNVVFAGAVSHDELPAVYASADVFVLLGDRTNATHTLYESMLSGLPVVALNTGRTADFVRDGETGVLLSPGELPRLPKVILELLGDAGRARSMGHAARAAMDAMLPTVEERQAMEVEVVERAVSERPARTRA